MIIGMGSDLCNIERIEAALTRHGDRFEKRCFTETDLCVNGRFLGYWNGNGGLPVFGLPLSEQRTEHQCDAIAEAKPSVQAFPPLRIVLHEVGNTVRLDIQSRREEIAVLQHLGATDGFIIIDIIQYTQAGQKVGTVYDPSTGGDVRDFVVDPAPAGS